MYYQISHYHLLLSSESELYIISCIACRHMSVVALCS